MAHTFRWLVFELTNTWDENIFVLFHALIFSFFITTTTNTRNVRNKTKTITTYIHNYVLRFIMFNVIFFSSLIRCLVWILKVFFSCSTWIDLVLTQFECTLKQYLDVKSRGAIDCHWFRWGCRWANNALLRCTCVSSMVWEYKFNVRKSL